MDRTKTIDESMAKHLDSLTNKEFYDFVQTYGEDWIKESILLEEGKLVQEKPEPERRKTDVVVLDLGTVAVADPKVANDLLLYIKGLDYYVVMGYGEKLLYKNQIETIPKLSYCSLCTVEDKAKYEAELTDYRRTKQTVESKTVDSFSERLARIRKMHNIVVYLKTRFENLFMIHSGQFAKEIIVNYVKQNYQNPEAILEALCEHYALFAFEYREVKNG